MSVDVGIWSKLSRLVLFLLCAAGVLGIGLWYLPLIQQNERMRKEIRRLEGVIAKEEKQARQMHAEITSLTQDPKAVERLARENLGYAKPDEVVIHFEPATTNTPVRY